MTNYSRLIPGVWEVGLQGLGLGLTAVSNHEDKNSGNQYYRDVPLNSNSVPILPPQPQNFLLIFLSALVERYCVT